MKKIRKGLNPLNDFLEITCLDFEPEKKEYMTSPIFIIRTIYLTYFPQKIVLDYANY